MATKKNIKSRKERREQVFRQLKKRYTSNKKRTVVHATKSKVDVENQRQALKNRNDRKKDKTFLTTERIRKETIRKKTYWTVRNTKTGQVIDKIPAKGISKLSAWNTFNKQAKKFDINKNILFAENIGPSNKNRGLAVKRYVTKNPDKRFGKRGQVQYKATAKVFFAREFQKKNKTPASVVIRGVEGYSSANARYSFSEKKEQAHQRWRAGVFIAIKRKYNIPYDENLEYEAVEISPSNVKEHVQYYVYE